MTSLDDLQHAVMVYGHQLERNHTTSARDFGDIIAQSDLVFGYVISNIANTSFQRGDGNYIRVIVEVLAHSPHCTAAYDRYTLYKAQWPNYCKKCGGWGTVSWTENQSPIGSGEYWPESFTDLCEACIGLHKCPRCGHQHPQSWNDFETKDDQVTIDPCAKCGFTSEVHGLPDYECMCWEEDAHQYMKAKRT